MLRVDHHRFRSALAEIEASIDAAWNTFCAGSGVTPGTPEAQELAQIVLQDTSEFDWRVVDGALKQLTCTECGNGLGAGPLGCAACDLANGFRFAAQETDRPDAQSRNEHALRVSSAVARTRHRYTPQARTGYELALPCLLAGRMPTTPQAQRAKDRINQLSDDELDRLIDPRPLYGDV
ncbi:hypothetical protein E1263_31020 [Kribbella antibiotica]|uniref:Uncharacterized protein n=1 Tax=Kribbella antibiotica TaxID=190195 RepID=A0A4R4Z383_9ACTN|nr:hypothetical protein [Kribbella antibiotica]TDD50492.1 hypothetical protein E1263_31020 [Kribbella antibiotica]